MSKTIYLLFWYRIQEKKQLFSMHKSLKWRFKGILPYIHCFTQLKSRVGLKTKYFIGLAVCTKWVACFSSPRLKAMIILYVSQSIKSMILCWFDQTKRLPLLLRLSTFWQIWCVRCKLTFTNAPFNAIAVYHLAWKNTIDASVARHRHMLKHYLKNNEEHQATTTTAFVDT